MLDKTIPFHSIIMKRSYSEEKLEAVKLPKGFKLRNYQTQEDGVSWAKIETAVLEFDTVEEAAFCHKNYLSEEEELKKRQWFVEDPDGKLVATATAWFQGKGKNRISVVHALSCLPEVQGLGLGRAVATGMLSSFQKLDAGKDIWLDTQTWSYKAIGLYLELGFVPVRDAVYNETKNEYEEALPILEGKMKEKLFQRFCDSTIEK